MTKLPKHASLAQKTEHTLTLLRDALARYGPERIAVAFTGGKDSTLALFLWRKVVHEALPKVPVLALNLDTGYKFPEIIAFRDKLARQWDLNLRVLVPEQGVKLPGPEDKAACCKARKIAPLLAALDEQRLALLITGVRADEHPQRRLANCVEQHPTHSRLHPLFDFGEMDVWAATQHYDLPWCVLYERGYRSLGCLPCTQSPVQHGGERSGRAAQKEQIMDELRALGYF